MWDWFTDEFVEVIDPDVNIESDDVLALWSHDPSEVLGRESNGSLVLTREEEGLRMELDLPDTQRGRDTWTLVQRGDINGMSFAFSINPGGEKWSFRQDPALCTITDMTIYEVSPVAFPAYPDTSVDARAQEHI